jgi:general secretion pathway protein I
LKLFRLIVPRNKGASAGFTLVEALVSLAVLAISLAAIGGLAASSYRSGLYVERHLAAVETAQAIVTGLPDRKDLAGGSLTGETAAHSWRVDTAPYLADFVAPTKTTVWSPQEIVVRVESPTGALLRFDTIRLVKKAAQ